MLEIETKQSPGGYPSYIPINAKVDGDFTVKDGNTGYILSGSTETTQNYRSDIRLTVYDKSENIGKSLTDDKKIDDANVHTFDGTDHVIDPSKFAKYESAKEGYQSMLDSDNTFVYGIHFMNAEISADRTFVAPEIKVNGIMHENYEMPIDAIDFTLQTQGYINFFGGSYFTNNNTFFSLHEIFRDGNKITEINEIEEIFSTGDMTDPFCYKYKGKSNYYIKQVDVGSTIPNGYSSIFKTSLFNNGCGISSRGSLLGFFKELMRIGLIFV